MHTLFDSHTLLSTFSSSNSHSHIPLGRVCTVTFFASCNTIVVVIFDVLGDIDVEASRHLRRGGLARMRMMRVFCVPSLAKLLDPSHTQLSER